MAEGEASSGGQGSSWWSGMSDHLIPYQVTHK
jgi:hypothetical protein